MASILDRYGIKEVADVTFYEINNDGTPGKPVLYLDTLKVSTIEQTAETAEARGGKGNPVLISWDYGKEINVSIEDALFSPKSMAIMFGDGNVTASAKTTLQRTVTVRLNSEGKLPDYFVTDVYDKVAKESKRSKVYMGAESAPAGQIAFDQTGIVLKTLVAEDGELLEGALTKENWGTTVKTENADQKAFVTFTVPASTNTITISGDSFPGTYYVVGDTYARSDTNGKDQFFQFVIPKAKMQAENTITLEAEGDPSVFNMGLKVLRPDSGEMMQLIQYDLT